MSVNLTPPLTCPDALGKLPGPSESISVRKTRMPALPCVGIRCSGQNLLARAWEAADS